MAAIVAFFTIFVWVFSIPLLVMTSVFWIPFGATLIVVLASISLCVQWRHHDTVVGKSIWRDFMSVLPMAEWFTPWSVSGQDEDGPRLLVCHPHGILCCGMVVYHFRAKHTIFAVAPILFHIPIFGWVARSWGLIPASERMIKKALREGFAVILFAGGVEELIAHPHRTLYIEKRFGYLNIAKDLDVPLVPVWVAGEFDTFYSPVIPFLKIRQKLCKYIGVGIMFPWLFGWKGIWLPKRVPLCVRFGEPVDSSGCELMELKRRYHAALRELIGPEILPATEKSLRIAPTTLSPTPRRPNRTVR